MIANGALNGLALTTSSIFTPRIWLSSRSPSRSVVSTAHERLHQGLAALELIERTTGANYAHLLEFATLGFYFVLLWATFQLSRLKRGPENSGPEAFSPFLVTIFQD